jgi:hypothetical protein
MYWCKGPDGGFSEVDAGCSPALDACAGASLPLEHVVHVNEPTQVAYFAVPPVSGPHWPCWEAWGPTHAALPAERFVHNLEHGGVVILVQCLPDAGPSDCDNALQPAINLTVTGPVAPQGDARYLVTPEPDVAHAYTALAWGWRLELDAWDQAAFECFAASHIGLGPEPVGADPSITACPQSYAP